MFYQSYRQIQELLAIETQKRYGRFPLKLELYSDSMTTMMALRRLKQADHHCFLLESAEPSRQWGRYSFLGYEPVMQITCLNGEVQITDLETGKSVVRQTRDPGSLIQIGRASCRESVCLYV